MPLGQIVRAEGRDHPRQEDTGARMEQPQEVCHGNAAPRPLRGRLAERRLEDRGSVPRASRAIDEKGALPRPPRFVHGGSLYGTAEAFAEEGEEGARAFRAGVTGGRRAEPQA